MNAQHLRIAAGVALAMFVIGCRPSDPAVEQDGDPTARPVRVTAAVELPDQRRLRIPAALRAANRAQLAFLSAGTLTRRHVELGQSVTTGQLLATLHNPALQPGLDSALARVGEAQARLEQLELDTRRQQTLVERNLAPTDALDQARTQRDAARAALDRARADLDQARNQLAEAGLRAPFDGVIAEFFVEPGDFAAAGQSVMALFGQGVLEAEIALPATLQPDAISSVELLRTANGERVEARIAEFGQGQPGRPRQVRIQATAMADGWQSGEPVQVALTFAGPERIAVPLTALVDPGTGTARLFRIREHRAERVAVATGRLFGERVAITGPIDAGDQIVIAGQAHLLDGELVRVLP